MYDEKFRRLFCLRPWKLYPQKFDHPLFSIRSYRWTMKIFLWNVCPWPISENFGPWKCIAIRYIPWDCNLWLLDFAMWPCHSQCCEVRMKVPISCMCFSSLSTSPQKYKGGREPVGMTLRERGNLLQDEEIIYKEKAGRDGECCHHLDSLSTNVQRK